MRNKARAHGKKHKSMPRTEGWGDGDRVIQIKYKD